MPIERRCPHSGALIFDLTPDEQQVMDLKSELREKLAMVDEKMGKLDELIGKHMEVSKSVARSSKKGVK